MNFAEASVAGSVLSSSKAACAGILVCAINEKMIEVVPSIPSPLATIKTGSLSPRCVWSISSVGSHDWVSAAWFLTSAQCTRSK